MATHSSVLTWRISGMGEPGGLPSMGLDRVGHDWSDLAAAEWNLEKWYGWTYVQDGNGDTDIGSRTWHSRGSRGWDGLRESHWNIYITLCKIDSQWGFAEWPRELKPGALWQPRGVGWDGKWEGGWRVWGDMCIPMTNSYWHRTEINPIL